MEHRLLELLTHYGAPLLFFAQLLGIFGLPIPDEFLLTMAGALARKGELSLGLTLLAAVTGCMSGITLSYVLGRTVGIVALRRVVHVPDEVLDRTHRWFARFGRWLLMFGYFIPGVRHVTALAAGSTPLEFRTFAAFAYPGAVVWSVGFVALGYLTGNQWQHAVEHVRGGLLWVAGLAVVGAAAWLVIVWRNRRRPALT